MGRTSSGTRTRGRGGRAAAPARRRNVWARWPDERLLDLRLCDLGLRLEGTWIQRCVREVYRERPLSDPALGAARKAVEVVLAAHEPFPALAVDRHWTLIAANRALQPLLAGIDPSLLEPPVNVLRASLHPLGLASAIVNYDEWRAHVLLRLRRQVDVSADPVLEELLEELRGYPAPEGGAPAPGASQDDYGGVAVPLRLRTAHGILSFVSTTTVFGTPVDITLSELALETFFPADEATGAALRAEV